MGIPNENLPKSCAAIESSIQQQEIALFEMPNESLDELMFRGAYLIVDKA